VKALLRRNLGPRPRLQRDPDVLPFGQVKEKKHGKNQPRAEPKTPSEREPRTNTGPNKEESNPEGGKTYGHHPPALGRGRGHHPATFRNGVTVHCKGSTKSIVNQ